MATKIAPLNKPEVVEEKKDTFNETAIRSEILKKIGNPQNVSRVQIIKVNERSARVNIWGRFKTDNVCAEQKIIHSEFYTVKS